ncbi:PepSY-like domain-containing protein [Flavobacterium sp. '19STA2R22 D10 B1']|uniref:PepSY-like domain-containing protein n=1 Tax=Flavobacterium aerium TaxID=3037261 RepID=UPI00278BED2E|nr:PepSY-like domain-containing protein [Flavobacterium sp. '19STA2R22 D10 B1']
MKTSFISRVATALLVLASFTMSAQDDQPIQNSELPKAATEFLKLHFKDNAIHHATKDVDTFKTSYEVMLADGTKVEFTKKGEWKEVDGKHKAIPTAFIPKAILTYVKTNYPTETITKIDRGFRDIDVDLSNGIDLEFDLKGNFIKIDR